MRKPPYPRLAFVPEFLQVMVLFDQESVHNGAYNFLGRKVTRTPIECSEDMFNKELFGTLRDSEGQWHDWSIFAWDPERRPVALFHVDRGFVTDPYQLVKGQYYCLAPYDNKPPSELIRCSYGFVDIPSEGLDYDAWLIALDPPLELKWAGTLCVNISETRTLRI